jgi:hypothetical protein
MFGCCVAGRLLQTNLQQVDDTHALFELPAASTINHVCIFLLGTSKSSLHLIDVCSAYGLQVPFPVGYGATVHFYWPGRGSQLLGMLVTFSTVPWLLVSSVPPGSQTKNRLRSSAFEAHSLQILFHRCTPHSHRPHFLYKMPRVM